MRALDSWSAFLMVLFALVGLCGLFASYAVSVPLERGLARSALLDSALRTGSTPETAHLLEHIRPSLGSLAAVVLDSPGPLAERIGRAREIVTEEERREAVSVGYRVRLMLAVVTVLSAALGAGLLAIGRRQAVIAATVQAASARSASATLRTRPD